jgi:hypothetical protein
MTHSGTENILDTLKDSWVNSVAIAPHEEDLRNLAQNIAQNLGIEYQQFPKWD